MQPETLQFRLIDGERDELVLKDPSQAVGNGFYEFAHFQTRGDGVVDFQQNAKPVALLPAVDADILRSRTPAIVSEICSNASSLVDGIRRLS